MEELAARQRIIEPSGGVLFARNTDGDQKRAARQHVLDLFRPNRWERPLRMLTMPGVQWRFERLLLGAREVGWFQASHPKRTNFTSIENERSIYYAAVVQMPGMSTPNALVKRVKTYSFAEHAVRTNYAAFFFANVDDMMVQDGWDDGWDAVWLDYTGPLTVERLNIIQHFYRRYVRDTLIVTALKARWNEKTSSAINRAGGHSQWLRAHLGGEILHDLEYTDTSPMAQFAVRKNRGLWTWL
jgi:hypothetical protein